jgi:integrase
LRREDFDGEAAPGPPDAHEGVILKGTKTDHGEPDAGRVVPVPATLARMIEAQIQILGEDCDLLFTTPTGRLWGERAFYRDLWKPAQEASSLDFRPHECRHSYVTHLRAEGINDADLAEIVEHRAETMLARYMHAVGGSFLKVRGAIG